jgi:hypothetical protein
VGDTVQHVGIVQEMLSEAFAGSHVAMCAGAVLLAAACR